MREKSEHRKFTPELREQAVRRVLDGHMAAAVARELDCDESLLHNWLTRYRLYLAVVLDLYSRAWSAKSMAERITKKFVMAALTMALFWRRPLAGLILHSDRGSQYAALNYQVASI